MTYHQGYRVLDAGPQRKRRFYIVDEQGLFYITRAGSKPRFSILKAAWKKAWELNAKVAQRREP